MPRRLSPRAREQARSAKLCREVVTAGRDPDDDLTFDLEDWLRGTDPWVEPMPWEAADRQATPAA